MADDDIERLLREVNAMNAPAGQPPARQESREPARQDGDSSGGKGGRLAFAVGSSVVVGGLGAAGGALMWFLPFVGPITTGFGAAVGAFVTALIAGPPRWFSS